MTDPRNDPALGARPATPERLRLLLEFSAEASAACLFLMVQGDVSVISLAHLLVAGQTGLVAGALSTLAASMLKTARPWAVSLMLGGITTVVDYLVHPGGFGPVALEAVLTGLMATLLSVLVNVLRYWWIVRAAPR